MTSVIGIVLKQIDEEIASMADSLAMGNAQSFEDYKYTVGRIRGLHSAKYHIEALVKQHLEEDD
jgi:hypothetical protein